MHSEEHDDRLAIVQANILLQRVKSSPGIWKLSEEVNKALKLNSTLMLLGHIRMPLPCHDTAGTITSFHILCHSGGRF